MLFGHNMSDFLRNLMVWFSIWVVCSKVCQSYLCYYSVADIYIYILDSHMAPYGACEVVQSWVRSCSVLSKEKEVSQNWAQSILIAKARSKQCSDFEGKRSKSELSTVNSDFEASAELSTVDCDVESSFKGVQCFQQKRGKSELSTVNGDFEGSAAVISNDLSTGAVFSSATFLVLLTGAVFSKVAFSDLSTGAMFSKVVFSDLLAGAVFSSVAVSDLSTGAVFSKVAFSDLSTGAVFPRVAFSDLSTGAVFSKVAFSDLSTGAVFSCVQPSQFSQWWHRRLSSSDFEWFCRQVQCFRRFSRAGCASPSQSRSQNLLIDD